MQPQQQYGQDFSIDYLNQISGGQKNRGGPSAVVMIIAASVAIIAVIIFAFILLRPSSSTGDKLQAVQLRIATLQAVADKQQPYLRNNDVASNSSTLQLVLENSYRDTTTMVEASKSINKKNTEKLTASEESLTTELNTEFNDARLNVTLDATYAREMAYQIDLLRKLITDAYKPSTAKNKETLKGIYDTLDPIREAFKNASSV